MSAKPQAHWSAANISELLDYLWSQRATLGDGSSFKAHVWTGAAVRVNALIRTKGTEKTAKSCKNKWTRLKDVYYIVAKIKAQSGFKWDDEKGADIDQSTAGVWEAYEKKNKGSAPFRNKGWIWWSQVDPLMPSSPRGANVFRASQVPQVPRDEQGEESDGNGPSIDGDGPQAGVDRDGPGVDGPESQETFLHWSPSPQPTIPHRQSTFDDDIPDSDGFDVSHPPPATPILSQQGPLKRKHSASSTENENTSKRPRSDARPSGARALHGIHDRLDDFTGVFHNAMSDRTTHLLETPLRKSMAMRRAQKLELTLSDERIVGLMDLFQADVTMADAYLSIKRHGVRKAWVKQHLKHISETETIETEIDDIYV